MKSQILQAAAAALCGVLIGYWIWHPRLAPVETAAPAEQLPSGGVLVERSPTAPVPQDVKQAAREVKGGKLERVVTVKIQPRPIQVPAQVRQDGATGEAFRSPPPTSQAPAPAVACACEAVEVQLGLVRMPGGDRRVVATATGGDIIGAIDLPIERATMARAAPRWNAMVMYGGAGYGAGAARRIGPLTAGAMAMKVRGEMLYFGMVSLPLF